MSSGAGGGGPEEDEEENGDKETGRGMPNQSFWTLLCSCPKNWPRRRSITMVSCSERTPAARARGRERRRVEGKG